MNKKNTIVDNWFFERKLSKAGKEIKKNYDKFDSVERKKVDEKKMVRKVGVEIELLKN